LSHITNPSTGETTDPAFTDLDDWLEFMKTRGKPVSKDVWGLFVDFVRTIDPDYANYDEDGELESSSVFHTRSSSRAGVDFLIVGCD
jgi:DCN1-like protein 1/2